MWITTGKNELVNTAHFDLIFVEKTDAEFAVKASTDGGFSSTELVTRATEEEAKQTLRRIGHALALGVQMLRLSEDRTADVASGQHEFEETSGRR